MYRVPTSKELAIDRCPPECGNTLPLKNGFQARSVDLEFRSGLRCRRIHRHRPRSTASRDGDAVTRVRRVIRPVRTRHRHAHVGDAGVTVTRRHRDVNFGAD